MYSLAHKLIKRYDMLRILIQNSRKYFIIRRKIRCLDCKTVLEFLKYITDVFKMVCLCHIPGINTKI